MLPLRYAAEFPVTLRLPNATDADSALAVLRGGMAPAPAGKRRRSPAPAVELFHQQLVVSGESPVRELRFAQEVHRQWRFDFAWPAERVAIEIDGLAPHRATKRKKSGATYTVMLAGGRHATVAGFEEDCLKKATAAVLGWTVLQFPQSLVRSGQALQFTLKLLEIRRAT